MEDDKTPHDDIPNPHAEGIGIGWAMLAVIAVTVAVIVYITL